MKARRALALGGLILAVAHPAGAEDSPAAPEPRKETIKSWTRRPLQTPAPSTGFRALPESQLGLGCAQANEPAKPDTAPRERKAQKKGGD